MSELVLRDDLVQAVEYDVLGKLPDPFVFDSGERVKTVEDWEKRRKEIYKTAIELQYGTQPPAPEVFTVEKLYCGGRGDHNCYKITAGTKEKTISFTFKVILPDTQELAPAVITGDLCFEYSFDKEYISALTDKSVALVLFNRTELAPDIRGTERSGFLYDIYPEYTFGAIGAWAWGYSRCVDALEQLGIVDMNCIVFTGHSRGAKTAILAGATDERAAIVNPNETCAGGCGCYRIHSKVIREDGALMPSETLADLSRNYSFWMGPELPKYAQREAELPFDAHYIKALVAPRVLFDSEAASDIWANPVGSWQTSEAAREVFKLYGKPENLIWYFRTGYHYHDVLDIKQLVKVIEFVKDGKKLDDSFYHTPFKKPDLIFDWRAPEE